MATLTLEFDSDNNPTNGYIVKYRQVGTTAYTTVTPNPTGSPIIITGLGSGATYEGTVQGDCGNGKLGTVSTFNATVAAEFNMYRDPSSAGNACSMANNQSNSSVFTFYAAVPVIQVNTQLYNDAELSSAFTTQGYYSDGVYAYQVNSIGVVVAKTPCNTSVTVVSATAYGAVCAGGSVNTVVGGNITVSGPVSQNTNFQIVVVYFTTGGNCSSGTATVTLSGVIAVGQSSGTVNPCTNGASAYGVSGICSATGSLT